MATGLLQVADEPHGPGPAVVGHGVVPQEVSSEEGAVVLAARAQIGGREATAEGHSQVRHEHLCPIHIYEPGSMYPSDVGVFHDRQSE